MTAFVDGGIGDAFRLALGLSAGFFRFHNMLRLALFFCAIAVFVGILFVDRRIADRFGFFGRDAAAFFALLRCVRTWRCSLGV